MSSHLDSSPLMLHEVWVHLELGWLMFSLLEIVVVPDGDGFFEVVPFALFPRFGCVVDSSFDLKFFLSLGLQGNEFVAHKQTK